MVFTITIVCILILCSICQWAAWRVKLPGIIFLLLIGIAVGLISGLVNPDQMLGQLFLPFVSFSNAQVIVPLVFSVIIGTVILQSRTTRAISVLLKVAEPEALGFLIIGDNTREHNFYFQQVTCIGFRW
ncbi:MAG: NhaP-type Na+/H+ or K+/H+ antiporter [Desulforhopalus sp.]|jgi:NhaP-type Na+/H+ or K+/H+ antiporter